MIKGADRLIHLKEYYFSRKLKEIHKLNLEGRDIINLGIGSPDLSPHLNVSESLSQSAQDPSHHGYQPYHGTKELRSAISDWMESQFSVNFDSNGEILPLLGSKEGILHISLAFLNAGDKVAIPELSYPAYRSVSKMVGAEVVEYPLDESWFPAWAKMDHCKDAKILWINYPHMPTGTAATLDVLTEAVEFGKRNDVLICHDNPYSHVLNENRLSIHNIEGSKNFSLELHSLSKSHNMAGWRVGWILGREDYLLNILKIKSNIDSGMFRPIQDAAITALHLGDEWHSERNKTYTKRQEIAFSIMDQIDCHYTKQQSGMFVWGELPNKTDSEKWSDDLLNNYGVFITPGFIFGERGRTSIRLSLCVDNDRLNEALNRLR